MRSRLAMFSPEAAMPAFVCALLLVSVASAQVEVWAARWDAGYDNMDIARSMVLTRDGDIVLTGQSRGPDNSWDIATLKVDGENGDTIWVRLWSSGAACADIGTAVAVDSTGSVFVAGVTFSPTLPDTDYVTLAYAADGTPVFSDTHDFGGSDKATAIVADESGGCYVTGAAGDTHNLDYATIRYAPDGTELWVSLYDDSSFRGDYATAVARDPSGAVYVTGYSWGGDAQGYDYLTVKYTPTGETLWTRRYDGTEPITPKDDYAFGIALGAGGDLCVTGRAAENGTYYDATTIRYAADGTRLWVNRTDWGENGYDGASIVRFGPGDGVVCAGFTETNLGMFDLLTFSIGTDSVTDWMRTYNYVNDDDSIYAMCVDDNGSVYIAAGSYSIDYDLDWVVAKYNRTGSQIWLARHSVYDEDDEPCGIATDRLGNVFVGGYDVYEGSEDYVVVKYSELDVGAAAVVAPADTYRLDATVVPRVWVRNYSALEVTFPVRLEVGNFYFDMQNVTALPPYDSTLVTFAAWPVRDAGTHDIRCYTMLTGDKEAANDTSRGVCTAVYVWELLDSMPPGAKGRGVKDGGSLAAARDSLVLAFKGNNTVEFYGYNTRSRRWATLESIPPVGRSGSRKRVKNGARLAPDTLRYVYALKGNNTYELWRYGIDGDSWRQMADVPPGPSERKVKGGSGLAFVPQRSMLYVMKGSNTVEAFGYFPARDSWAQLSNVPPGPSGRRAKDGSAIAYDGDSLVYFLKGGTYEFWSYNALVNSWRQRKDIPNAVSNPRRRKPKKGASLAFDPEFRRVYATKGGKQTEWWYFDLARDLWVESADTFPRWPSGKSPYGGSNMVYGAGKLFALKGNKTREFWRYHADLPLNPPLPDGGQDRPASRAELRFQLAPSLLRDRALATYTVPQAGRVRLAFYDIAGRQRLVAFDGVQPPGRYSLPLSARSLGSGVYVARLQIVAEDRTFEAGQKVLVTR